MGLILPFDPAGLDPKTTNVLDEMIAAIQTWAGKKDGAGKWIDVPYSAGMFRAVNGTWTVEPGDLQVFRYSVLQDLMFMRVLIFHSSTDASIGNDLRISLPDGYRSTDHGFIGVCQWDSDNGAGLSGIGSVFGFREPFNNQIRLVRDVLPSSTNWPASESNSFSIRLNVVVPVQQYEVAGTV